MTAPSRWLAVGLLLGALACAAGCTVRHSQTLVGSIERVSGASLKQRDTGIEVGIGSAAQGLTLSEPTAPHELLQVTCEVSVAHVDYRSMVFFFYYLTAGFPQAEVVSYCITP